MKALLSIASVLLLLGCTAPQTHGRGETVYRSCQICGKCQPFLDAINCTMTGCDCCNRCIWTMRCAETGEDYPMVVNECDEVIWIVKKSEIDGEKP